MLEAVMKRDSAFRQVAILGFAVFGFIGALAPTAWANGEEFFAPAKNSKIDLVYFGRIKDSQTGRSVTDSVYFVLTDKKTGLSFPFVNDKPGHFRSPDVGTAIKEIGEQIDVNGFEVTVNVAGYKRATIARMPRKAQGAIELDVRLDPVISGDVLAAGVGGVATQSSTQSYTTAAIVLIGALLAWVIARGVRTSGHPPTTAR
jgi:hypothetical protein